MKKFLLTGCLISALWLTGASSAMAATSGTSTVNITVPSVTALYVENDGPSIDFDFTTSTPGAGYDFITMGALACTKLHWTNNTLSTKKITVSANYLPPGATLSFYLQSFSPVDGLYIPITLDSTFLSADLVTGISNSVANYNVNIDAAVSIREGITVGTHTTTLTYTIEDW